MQPSPRSSSALPPRVILLRALHHAGALGQDQQALALLRTGLVQRLGVDQAFISLIPNVHDLSKCTECRELYQHRGGEVFKTEIRLYWGRGGGSVSLEIQ